MLCVFGDKRRPSRYLQLVGSTLGAGFVLCRAQSAKSTETEFGEWKKKTKKKRKRKRSTTAKGLWKKKPKKKKKKKDKRTKGKKNQCSLGGGTPFLFGCLLLCCLVLPSASSSTRFGEPWLVHANYTEEKSQAGDCQNEKPWSVYADYTWKMNQTSVVSQEVLPQLVYANGTEEMSLTLDKGNGVENSKGSYVQLGAWAVGRAPAAEHGAMAVADWRWRRDTCVPSNGLLVTDLSRKKDQHLKLCKQKIGHWCWEIARGLVVVLCQGWHWFLGSCGIAKRLKRLWQWWATVLWRGWNKRKKKKNRKAKCKQVTDRTKPGLCRWTFHGSRLCVLKVPARWVGKRRCCLYKNKIKRKLFFMNKFAFDRFSHTIPVVSLNLGDGSRQHSPCVMFRGGGGAGAAATKRKHQEKILLQGLKELLQNIGTADEPPVRGRSPVRESTPERAPSLSRSRSPSPAWQVKGKGKRKGKKGKENGEAHVHFEEAETQTHDTLLARLKAIVLAAETNKARNLLTDLQTLVQSYTPTEAPPQDTTSQDKKSSGWDKKGKGAGDCF